MTDDSNSNTALRQLDYVLATFGSHASRWPEDQRAKLLELIARDVVAQKNYAEAKALDAALDREIPLVKAGSAALSARIIDAARFEFAARGAGSKPGLDRFTVVAGGKSATSVAAPWRSGWAMAASLAASLVLGLALGSFDVASPQMFEPQIALETDAGDLVFGVVDSVEENVL